MALELEAERARQETLTTGNVINERETSTTAPAGVCARIQRTEGRPEGLWKEQLCVKKPDLRKLRPPARPALATQPLISLIPLWPGGLLGAEVTLWDGLCQARLLDTQGRDSGSCWHIFPRGAKSRGHT